MAEFCGVIPVVEPQGHNLAGLARGQQRDVRQDKSFPGFRYPGKGIFPDGKDFFPVENPIPRPAFLIKAHYFHPKPSA